jgi:hypothetical protein
MWPITLQGQLGRTAKLCVREEEEMGFIDLLTVCFNVHPII